jgi:DNA helicase II / ATP-dependent DNA helicase PcrA
MPELSSPAAPPASPFDRLNARQREAARFGGQPLLIIAGAGTGKTNTLAHRVAHLLLEGARPERILLLTFTRRAALEMTRRTQRIVGELVRDVRLPWSGTFHSVANRLLRQHCASVGLEPSFSVLDRGDAADLMDVVRHELRFSQADKRFPRKDTCLAIYSHRVNTQGELGDTLETLFPWCVEWQDELTRLYRAYVEKKLANQALDYDDLLLYWHAMMSEPQLARYIGEQFDHILVDEYQDTNVLQAEILKNLRPDGAGVTVVGDDAQSIYSFRAATVENILGFPTQYAKPAAVVTLEENYRSTQAVLDSANALMADGDRQYRKSLRAVRGAGRKARYVTVADDQGQADYVVARVLEARERGVPMRRQAVLFRSSHHSDLLELELARRNIPYVKYGGLKFLEAAHVKDMLSVMRWSENPKNRVAAFRALQILPGMGPVNAERCIMHFEAGGHDWRVLGEFKPPSGTADAWSEFRLLMTAIAVPHEPWQAQLPRVRAWFEPHMARIYDSAHVREADLVQLERIAMNVPTREHFLTELALDPPQVTSDLSGTPHLDEDFLVLSTIHSAKGQEWEAVHLLNVSDGNFPSEYSTGRPELIEEERRLLYVAMTRAKSELHLIAPLKYYVTAQSRKGDRHVYGAKSRFMTRAVMATLEPVIWPGFDGSAGAMPSREAPRVNVADKLRGFWT